jgi:hypothetical protein
VFWLALVEGARCMLIHSGLPLTFWAEAVYYQNMIINSSPTYLVAGNFEVAAWCDFPCAHEGQSGREMVEGREVIPSKRPL